MTEFQKKQRGVPPLDIAHCPDCGGILIVFVNRYSDSDRLEVECPKRVDEAGESARMDEPVGYHTYGTDAWQEAEGKAIEWFKGQR